MILLLAWVFVLGAAIGSFLNVVVYRLPAGKSIAWPGSYCPGCSHPIRWYDNLPILGWVLLGGRCRDCKMPISARYPLVEAATAAMFVAVVSQERPPYGVSAYHLVLLCTLLAAALIRIDGHRLPWRLLTPAWLIGLIAGLAFPFFHPLGVSPDLGAHTHYLLDWVSIGVGFLIGLVLLTIFERSNEAPGNSAYEAQLPMVVGLFLGLQAVVILGVTVVIFHVVYAAWRCDRPTLPRLPLAVWWFLGTLVWAVIWRLVLVHWPWPIWSI